MRSSHVLVSCSHMESYGMALMEARVLGVPILAQLGGHVPAIVGRDSGGELFENATELVATLLRTSRDRTELGSRMALARARTLPVRPWSEAALEFVSQVAELERGGALVQGEPTMQAGLQEGLHGVC